jgi:hypothetical protein
MRPYGISAIRSVEHPCIRVRSFGTAKRKPGSAHSLVSAGLGSNKTQIQIYQRQPLHRTVIFWRTTAA